MPRVLRSSPKIRDRKRELRKNMTKAELRLWQKIRYCQLSVKFRRQHGIGPFIVDFYCPEKSLVVEVDGDVHATENQIAKDREREQYLKVLGLKIVRYSNDDIFNDLEAVLQELSQHLS